MFVCTYIMLYVCRLINELRGWVLGHEELLKRSHQKQDHQELPRETESKAATGQKRRPKKVYQPPRKMKAAMKGQLRNVYDSARYAHHTCLLKLCKDSRHMQNCLG